MERSGDSRKRAREGEGIEEDHPASSVAKIKPNLITSDYYLDHQFGAIEKQHNFDSIFHATNSSYINNNNLGDAGGEEGLFDFPWLKEVMTFKAEDQEEFDLDNVFASSYASSTPDDASDSKIEDQILCQIPKLHNLADDDDEKKKKKINYEDEVVLPSFQADQLEGADWICSSVFD